ncbi:hypothetical protein SEPCBS57363_004875 [Sporothrix epigloea]|uniref:Integral membrane channel protein n=1 Tax=Sporothrix epigloea TaxID=1892477 RepID=A0ABP0DVN1_9PEZI
MTPEQDEGQSPGPATRRPAYAHPRHATADFTEADDDDDDSNDGGDLDATYQALHDLPQIDEDGGRQSSHVLPLFSASHLDSLPVYSIVHTMRIIVQARTETTLTWEQLRSPQVSQFLVKPMQQQIRAQHFSRATLYALMANCLQFAKEAQFYPGNAGTSNTRAKVCELLAIKLLKEYTTRELIDALSYDFNPLQGIPGGPHSQPGSAGDYSGDGRYIRPGSAVAARTSTLEVAIRASAKHFLAHPLVVQQLEAIWNGAISFYSSADSLHRNNGKAPTAPASPHHYGTRRGGASRGSLGRPSNANDMRIPLLSGGQHRPLHQQVKEEPARALAQPSQPHAILYRRTVALYDPKNASLFKLSRLRVPRYRQFLSTCSLAVLIGLFLAVLVQHSSRITTLELVFWFWSAGFMLDELVGFNEQGFSLYIMSFWNIFDLGILLLLIIYYSLRVCGVFLADAQRWNNSAYDILAANAILLLPRIFSVLDHYQYFSQLLIAFRLMAVDLVAVFVLILVSCSGFFVFFTLSRTENDPSDVAYMIFQLLMGFTPAAWEVWPTYNILGRTLLVLFLIICHFVVVTILITVLTNSFMAIASNADEEHQFLFAINTISMVKNDALFSYVAPTNIFAWMLTPLRYCIPLPQFVALNRIIIKITHFPLLFSIYVYEKFFLAPFMYEPTDLVENHHRSRHRGISFADRRSGPALFSPSIRFREESVVGFQKDRALDEVFRRTPGIATLRTQRRNERRKTQTAIRNWMDQNDGLSHSPPHNYSAIDKHADTEWQHRMSMHRERGGSNRLRYVSEVRSTASDPVDLISLSAMPGLDQDVRSLGIRRPPRSPFEAAFKDHTDAEGDDELLTNEDEEDEATNTGDNGLAPSYSRDEIMTGSHSFRGGEQSVTEEEENDDLFATPIASRFLDVAARSPGSPGSSKAIDDDDVDVGHTAGGIRSRRIGNIAAAISPPKLTSSRRALHSRALSTNTILYNPPNADSSDDLVLRHSPGTPFFPTSPKPAQKSRSRPMSSQHDTHTAATMPGTPTTSGQRSPRKSTTNQERGGGGARPRPIIPPREPTQSTAASRAAAVFNTATMIGTPIRHPHRRASSFDIGSESDAQSELLTASAVGPALASADAALPGSFTSQMALATAMNNARATGETDRDRDRMSRLVLARMKTLEESFADVVLELRSLQKQREHQHRDKMASGRTSAVASIFEGEASSHDTAGGRNAPNAPTAVLASTRVQPAAAPSTPVSAMLSAALMAPSPAAPPPTPRSPSSATGTDFSTSTPRSPTDSRIPVSVTVSGLVMPSAIEPGRSQSGGNSHIVPTSEALQSLRPAISSDNASEVESRMPRRAKGKEVERDA